MIVTRQPRHQLTHPQFYQLCEWIKTADMAAFETYTEIARSAQNIPLPFAPDTGTIKRALDVTGVAFTSNRPNTTAKPVAGKDVDPLGYVLRLAGCLRMVTRTMPGGTPPGLEELISELLSAR